VNLVVPWMVKLVEEPSMVKAMKTDRTGDVHAIAER
jgi:hypothetical protein